MVKYTVLVYDAEPDEGGYWARVAELPGCVTQGETIDEVRVNIVDAIEEYLHAKTVSGGEAPPAVADKFEVTVG
jgi:antitoxin HicB